MPIRIDARAEDVAVTADAILFSLADGRELSSPLDWSPKLQTATSGERNNWHLVDHGRRVRWPEVDEEIAIADFLRAE